jgi:hypothetical protein
MGEALEKSGVGWLKKEESGVKWGIKRYFPLTSPRGRGLRKCFSAPTSHALMKRAASYFLRNFAKSSLLDW